MSKDLHTARQLLSQGTFTCVLCREDAVYTSTRRGVAPLMAWLEEGLDLAGFSAADKVVGKATALLYCLLGVKAVYAGVISRAALGVFQARHMPCSYGELVPAIRNRTGDGLCPMESATLEIDDPALAPDAIRAALKRLTAGK